MKEITVVMPVYKVEKYVSECLDSIINQTFDCFECIIIDDCSPDNSMRLIEEKLAGYKEEIHSCSKCGLCQSVCPIYKITGNDSATIIASKAGMVQ